MLSGIRAAVLFEETRLVHLLADLRVRLNPSVAERVGNAPGIWVQVKCAKRDVGKRKVGGPVEAFTIGVRVRAVSRETKTFIADSDLRRVSDLAIMSVSSRDSPYGPSRGNGCSWTSGESSL
jgi:hypothetical protein